MGVSTVPPVSAGEKGKKKKSKKEADVVKDPLRKVKKKSMKAKKEEEVAAIAVPKKKTKIDKADKTYKQYRLIKLKDKQKRKKTPKPKADGKKDKSAADVNPKVAYERCDVREFLHVWEKFLNAKQLSAVEKEDYKLDESHFDTCNQEATPETKFLSKVVPHWSEVVQAQLSPCGAPYLMVITASAVRAVELNRAIKGFKTDKCQTVKLFAKHIKAKSQIAMLQRNPYHMAIGTPKRYEILLEAKALKVDNLSRIVLDFGFRDAKTLRLVDIRDTRADLLELSFKFLVPLVKAVPDMKIVLM